MVVMTNIRELGPNDIAVHPRKHDQENHSEWEFGRYERWTLDLDQHGRRFSPRKPPTPAPLPQQVDFRYNHHKITDGERSCRLIGKVAGKRFMCSDLVPAKPEPISQV